MLRRLVFHPALLTVIAILLLIDSAGHFRPFRLALIPRGFMLLLVGGAFLLAALAVRRQASPVPQPDPFDAHLIGERLGNGSYLSAVLGLVALLLLLLINANPPFLPPAQFTIHLQYIMFVGGVFLLVWGLTGARLPSFARLGHLLRVHRVEIGMVAFLTGFSLLLRLWQLETAVHTFIDELLTLRAVNQLAIRGDMVLLLPYSGSAFFPWLYPYLQLAPLTLFGHTLAALRFASVLLGAFTIPGLYLLAKNLFDRQTALAAALMLATFPPHIHLTRQQHH